MRRKMMYAYFAFFSFSFLFFSFFNPDNAQELLGFAKFNLSLTPGKEGRGKLESWYVHENITLNGQGAQGTVTIQVRRYTDVAV